MLAVVAQSFGEFSETFIHDHARLLSPGATVLIARNAAGIERFGYPYWVEPERCKPTGTLSRKLTTARRILLSRYDPVLAAFPIEQHSRFDWRSGRDLRKFLKESGSGVLLAEYGPVGWRMLPVCRKLRISLYVHFHGWDVNVLGKSRIMRRRYKTLFDQSAGLVVTTNFLRDRLLNLGAPPEKVFICPCGIDTKKFSPEKKDAGCRRILMVSRLIELKGPHFSMQAFAKVLNDFPEAALGVVGDGPMRRELERMAEELGIERNVFFHGAKDHKFVRDQLRTADVFIQHSVSLPGQGCESLGLTILEAMSSGCPVVATRHGAITETVLDGVTGILVEEGDIGGMGNAICELLMKPDLRTAMGIAGRRRVVEHYDQENCISRLRGVLSLPNQLYVSE